MADTDTLTERANREKQGRKRRTLDPKKLMGIAVASVCFIAFAYFVLNEGGSDGSDGVTVNGLSEDGGGGYRLLQANGPSTREEAIPDTVTAAAPPPASAPAPTAVSSGGPDLTALVRANEGYVQTIADLRTEIGNLKVELATKASELSIANSSLETLQRDYDRREDQFRSELAQAVADAQANALAGLNQPSGISEDERRRLEELRALRRRQNEAQVIIYDENPYGR